MNREEWINSHNADKTKNQSRIVLRAFDDFLNSKNYTEDYFIRVCQANPENQKYIMVGTLAQYWKSTKSTTTIQNYLIFILDWLRWHNIKLDNKELKKYTKLAKPIKKRSKPLEMYVIQEALKKCSKPWHKAILAVLISSGMRQGEALKLRVKDFDFENEPVKIIIPGEFTKGKEERETYISKEAANYLKPLIKDLSPDSRVFQYTQDGFQSLIKRLRKKTGLYFKAHRLRAYIKTKAANVHNSDYAEALIGHSGYLQTYYDNEESERNRMYNELEKSVTINPI